MTIPVSDTSVTYTGNNATTIWPFSFRTDEGGHLLVSLITIATGAEVLLSSASYAITGIGNPEGGSITYPLAGAPLSPLYKIKIARIVPLLQELNLSAQGAYDPEAVEQALDHIVMMIQQLGIAGGGVSVGISTNQRSGSILLLINGGGGSVSPGIKCDIPLPFNGSITEAILLGDQAGSIVVDIWKNTYASYPPSVGNSIVAAAKPTIVNDIKYRDVVLTGWATVFAAGDILRVNVESVSGFNRVTMGLSLIKT